MPVVLIQRSYELHRFMDNNLNRKTRNCKIASLLIYSVVIRMVLVNLS